MNKLKVPNIMFKRLIFTFTFSKDRILWFITTIKSSYFFSFSCKNLYMIYENICKPLKQQ